MAIRVKHPEVLNATKEMVMPLVLIFLFHVFQLRSSCSYFHFWTISNNKKEHKIMMMMIITFSCFSIEIRRQLLPFFALAECGPLADMKCVISIVTIIIRFSSVTMFLIEVIAMALYHNLYDHPSTTANILRPPEAWCPHSTQYNSLYQMTTWILVSQGWLPGLK